MTSLRREGIIKNKLRAAERLRLYIHLLLMYIHLYIYIYAHSRPIQTYHFYEHVHGRDVYVYGGALRVYFIPAQRIHRSFQQFCYLQQEAAEFNNYNYPDLYTYRYIDAGKQNDFGD